MLAAAGWAMSSAPAAPPASEDTTTTQSSGEGESSNAPAAVVGSKAYSAAPAPCGSLSEKSVKDLVPGAKTAGKEIPSTDAKLRRTCSWNALKGYDYRWLDISFEIKDSETAAKDSFKDRVAAKSGGGDVPGIGSAGYSVVNLASEDKQQSREGLVVIRSSNAIVAVTYSGSNFESKQAPPLADINKGAIKAAREAFATLADSQKS
ncbi:hypothetical protein SZN_23371 [Streptomyces zinciresistens K42]|uniref:Secreted protein n=1 Tax=Streptomyces zinciresistens K42 TaxID=700597 RepID=G2GGP0_9ACTN|nr:hypothetical protein SZN_23371 [Streptomyces zinciresistens K42]